MVSGESISILLVSDLDLVAQAVKVALGTRGFEVHAGAWTAASRLDQSGDVGMLITDSVDGGRRLRLLRQVPDQGRPWLIVTGSRRGPSWGALLAAGFLDVLPSTMTLDEMEVVIRSAVEDAYVLRSASRRELLSAWFVVEPELRALEERVQRLSLKELEILDQLYEGSSVAAIAQRSGVAEATVRSQVRSLFRKLQVRSQLAAVAAYATCQS